MSDFVATDFSSKEAFEIFERFCFSMKLERGTNNLVFEAKEASIGSHENNLVDMVEKMKLAKACVSRLDRLLKAV